MVQMCLTCKYFIEDESTLGSGKCRTKGCTTRANGGGFCSYYTEHKEETSEPKEKIIFHAPADKNEKFDAMEERITSLESRIILLEKLLSSRL